MRLATIIASLLLCLLVRMAGAEPPPAGFAYVLQADALAKNKSAAVRQLAASDRDWLVLDAAFDSETPWERADLAAIRQGHPGRRVMAYLSIGEAEDYRSYWHREWTAQGRLTPAAPAWLLMENPEWKGNYRVKYWRPEWQQLMLADVDAALAHGFDGVYLDIVDGFETFEQNGGEYLDDRLNPETKQTYRRDMVDWVKAIAARARADHPGALVIPQNGSPLLAQPDFLATISAIGIEDLFTDGNKLQSRSHTAEVLADLQRMTAVQKPVLLVEYPVKPDRQALVKRQARENGLVWLVTDRPLKTLGESGR